MSKGIKRIISVAAPIVGAAFGGPVGAAFGGAIGGAINGGGIRGAAIGGITGYLGSAAGSAVSGVSSAPSAATNWGVGGSLGEALDTIQSAATPSVSSGVGAAVGNTVRSLSQPIVGNLSTGQLLNAASGVVGDLNQEAALDAARNQVEGLQSGIDATSAALAPYTKLGKNAVNRIGEIQADPAAYIKGNELYNSLAADAERRLTASQAAKGKVGSGGTADALQERLLNLGTNLVNTDIGNLQQQAGIGANSASQVATTAANGQAGIGAAQAAGTIGANNALTSTYQNQINTILAQQGLNKAATYYPPINL